MKRYQSHAGENSISNTARKLERIQLPLNLAGKSVLDLGCNEGFFCAEAVRRGATRVVGIDNSSEAIEFAKKQYPFLEIEFLLGTWDKLPEGLFDIILWLSAMHYEYDPKKILRQISGLLSPNGVLILECGIYNSSSSQLLPVLRPKDIAWYPTSGIMGTLLSDYGIREVGAPELTPGDPVPRSVYHCKKRLPTVLLIRGKSAIGKSSLTRLLTPVSCKTILIDHWLELLSQNNENPSKLIKYLAENFTPDNIESVCKDIDANGLTDEFAGMLANGIAASDTLVVIDGYVTDIQAAELATKISRRALLFVVDRVLFPQRLSVNSQSLDFTIAQLLDIPEFKLTPSEYRKCVIWKEALATLARTKSTENVRLAKKQHVEDRVALMDRAERAETYNRALLHEQELLKHAYDKERQAWQEESANALREVGAQTERAVRSETYALELLKELKKLQGAD